MYRRRSIEINIKKLPKHRGKSGCAFCGIFNEELNPQSKQIIKKVRSCSVIENIFPYDVWEQEDVGEHLMIIPNRHVTSMSDLSDDERQEMMDLFCQYEAQGYNLYTRAPQNKNRTIAHIHTHLIKHKAGSKLPKLFSLWLRKPYLLIKY
jgi:diadenosine tetraphosphate (Ap4A) HIT family hydrolase